MADAETKKDTPKMANWVVFPKKEALLKRLIDENGNPGLILRVADNEDGARVAQMAEAAGFQKKVVSTIYTLQFERGKPVPFKTSEIARMLGGEVQPMLREKLISKDMLINLYDKSPSAKTRSAEQGEGASQDAEAPVPVPENIEMIGLNMRGEEVVRDAKNRFFRKVSEEGGSFSYIHESVGEQPALFYRARKPEDLMGVAAGLVFMARRGTLHQADFDRVLDAVMEPSDYGQIDMDRDDVASRLREHTLRQITNLAIERDADRSAFGNALRAAGNTSFIFSKETQASEPLQPSASLLSLLRRLSMGFDRVNMRGHEDLKIALPRLEDEKASLQIQDLSEVQGNGVSDFVNNVLVRRPAEGSSIFLLPQDISSEDFDRVRFDVGIHYGLELVADIAPGIADGVRDGRSIKALFVGDRRPEPLESLPQAALRTFPVSTQDDLMTMEREILRSRRKIREFNIGEEATPDANDDNREENMRQRPYQPLSRVGEPFTMIPRPLEGATTKALKRVALDAEPYGGLDAMVAQAMGRGVGDLGEILTPEQVDAIGLRMSAAKRGRGFLEADQTGVGKGRTMASMVNIHLRESKDNRCLYFTESAAINVPDVMRDLKAVGALDRLDADGNRAVKVMFLTSGSEYLDVSIDPKTGAEIQREIISPKPRERKQIFESGTWPIGYDLVISTYSQFNVRETDPRATWLTGITSESTLIVMDEAHNALNPRSNTGRNLRAAIANLPAQNVLFATGTPARNPLGMDLYHPLLPQGEAANVSGILENIASGGEVAQEAFATMLAEDGVMIRRDHDLSATDYQVYLPDDQKIMDYQDTMNRFGPIVESMIDVSTQIGEIVGRAQALEYRRMVNQGIDEREARTMTNELSQYSLSIGGPLSNLSRIMMNAIKVDQVVEAAVSEMRQGRKPLITFHTTYEALMKEKVRDENGNVLSDEALADMPQLSVRDHIRRIHNSLYKMKIDGETLDPRENNSDIMRAFRRFVRSARNPGSAATTIVYHAEKMVERINAIGDPDERARILTDFNDVYTRILPDSVEIQAQKAFAQLKNGSYVDRARTGVALEAFAEAFLAVDGDKFPEGAVAEINDAIDLIREYAGQEDEVARAAATRIFDAEIIPTEAVNNMVENIAAHMRKVDVPRVMNRSIRDALEAISTSVDALGGDRAHYDAINETFARIDQMINDIPDLPVSPVDAIIERLEANDIRAGEISGRTYCYRDGRIQKRANRNRKETVDDFNSGNLEALIYNSAGATGGSYHAGKTFSDQRPRTLIEFEAPLDVIKYVQAQGRGNRYDQVASPKVLSVVTGLTPEMRIFQQRNAKLRSLGASVDGNRSHPLLLDDVPDFLNKVGDEATAQVLAGNPALARRLGFPKFIEEYQAAGADLDGDDTGSGVAKSGLESLANKVLARSIMLPANEQDNLINRIKMEFDVLIEELESRNANPLRPKEFGGTVDIKTSTLFSGQELEDEDLDTSVFLSPVYMMTGEHDLGEDPIAADRLISMVERAITMHGSDGFKPYADRIQQNLSNLMRPFLPSGYDMADALLEPTEIPGRFGREYEKLTDLAWVLENIQPGVAVRFPSVSDLDGRKLRTIVDLVPPRDASHYSMPSAYKIKTICPGDGSTETIALSRMMSSKMESIVFRPGISNGFNDAYLNEFSLAANMRRMLPVQILGGNILQAITTANKYDLGTISLYRNTEGQWNRGILVHDSKIDMRMLPVALPSATVAAEVATQFCRSAGNYSRTDSSSLMRIWGAMDPASSNPGARDNADIIIRLTSTRAKIDIQPLRVSNADFYLEREGLYEAIYGRPIPDPIPLHAYRKAGTNHKYISEFRVDTPEGRDRLYTLLEHFQGLPLMTDGVHRDLTNDTLELINTQGPRGKEVEEGVVFFSEETDEENNGPEIESDFEGVI